MNAIAQFLLLADRMRSKAEGESPARREELDQLARRYEERAIERLLGTPVIWADRPSEHK